MIEIKDKKDCCGCSACVQKCPKQCISLKEDYEGFLYPEIDKVTCIDCGLCEKVCPVLLQGESRKPLKVYAAKNINEVIRRQSSSGGIFTLLAEQIIQEGGVIFGARFDENWEVKHDYTETVEGLVALRSSKYVQSRIEDNYRKAEDFLKQGRKVLFCGTPCQIAGLKRFLRKEYINLLTVDFVCHGVPSPGVWKKYLKETVARMCDKNSVSTEPVSKENAHIKSISFRDKRFGWKQYSFTLTISTMSRSGVNNTVSLCEVKRNNIFLRGFLADLYLRPSCHACAFRCGRSGSDITIGDLWGSSKIIDRADDDKGYSLMMLYNEFGISKNSLWLKEIDYEDVINGNPVIITSVAMPKKRNAFFDTLQQENDITQNIIKHTDISQLNKLISKGKSFIKRLMRIVNI